MSRYDQPYGLLYFERDESLAKRIFSRLKKNGDEFELIKIEEIVFANKEIMPRIPKNIRGKDIFLLLSMNEPDPNTALIRLFLTCRTIIGSSINKFIAVLPFLAYLRQDRKKDGRVPISARDIAKLIEIGGADQVVTFDPHTDQAEGFFDAKVSVANLKGMSVYVPHILRGGLEKTAVVSTDAGGAQRARRLRDILEEKSGIEISYAIIDKERAAKGGGTKAHTVVGDVNGRDCIIVDDMIDTGGSIVTACEILRNHGTQDISVYATHGIFSPTPKESTEARLSKLGIHVTVTESILRSAAYREKNAVWLTILNYDELLAEVIHRITTGESVSELS
ncbi:ribose-phosphate diphosphokinase [bacterium]|nr:ribose-phosphate diphosphokinase [bacterium]MCI0680341.1 ribose-phosphate diphosphokinase [bacterium]